MRRVVLGAFSQEGFEVPDDVIDNILKWVKEAQNVLLSKKDWYKRDSYYTPIRYFGKPKLSGPNVARKRLHGAQTPRNEEEGW